MCKIFQQIVQIPQFVNKNNGEFSQGWMYENGCKYMEYLL